MFGQEKINLGEYYAPTVDKVLGDETEEDASWEECMDMPAEGYYENKCQNVYVGQHEEETNCRTEETNCRDEETNCHDECWGEEGWDCQWMCDYEWVCDSEYVCDHEWVDDYEEQCEEIFIETSFTVTSSFIAINSSYSPTSDCYCPTHISTSKQFIFSPKFLSYPSLATMTTS